MRLFLCLLFSLLSVQLSAQTLEQLQRKLSSMEACRQALDAPGCDLTILEPSTREILERLHSYRQGRKSFSNANSNSRLNSSSRHSIDGEFDGCDYDKLYPLLGGGILECEEYNYFYEYSPEVRSVGNEVITIGDEKVQATLHDGSVINTRVDGEFEGCDYGKRIRFINGWTFECSTYSYTYSYSPSVRIIVISGRTPKVYIKDREYRGSVYR